MEEIYISSEPDTTTVLFNETKPLEKKAVENESIDKTDKESLRQIICNNIRTLRLRHSMSLEELSARMGITLGFFGLMERGHRGVTAYNLDCLSRIFNISIDEFFTPPNIELHEVENISAI